MSAVKDHESKATKMCRCANEKMCK
jgi:hypothetical protein